MTTITQLVVIYDSSLFYKNNKDSKKGIVRVGKMAAGYLLYVLPVGCIGYLFLFVNSIFGNSFICQDMKAPFLLNNNFTPAVNIEELYLMRRESCKQSNCGTECKRLELLCDGRTE